MKISLDFRRVAADIERNPLSFEARDDDVTNAEQKTAPVDVETEIDTNASMKNGTEAHQAEAPDALAVVSAERDELKDKLLRTLAEMENLRRRTEREVADARNYGVTKFATDMVGVVDNMRRALEAVPTDALASAEGAFKALFEGVELSERDLLKSLERHGVRKIEPKGEKFDPNLHQAMFEAPDPETPKGHVMQVVQPGFTIAGRSLRAALVGVSSGGPKVDKTA